jgi:cellulose synthase/poly-beta-1,6-N-acetylglucosamine synthase-like glycosyltransferase
MKKGASMSSFFDSLIKSIGSWYYDSTSISWWIYRILAILTIYKTFYLIIGTFFTRIFPKAKKNHKYAIVIAARNEEKVIGNLLDSINKQDYPKKLITTFVVCDNCTDKTYEVAKKHGAICYKRFDDKRKTKGYALQYLFECIKKDYKIDCFEGYFVFDADNLLEKDYVTRMNEAFDAGEKIITSYRNSKNFDENWISANYAIHWLRSIRTAHRARSILRLATNIQGTGFLFSNELVKNGWKYTSLTEDRAFTADAVKEGYRISYNDKAVFYDEQPVNLKIALRQRLRWSKGHLQAFIETGPGLFINIFFGKMFRKNKQNVKSNIFLKIVESIRHRFASFDMFMLMLPNSVMYFLLWFIFSCILYSNNFYITGINGVNIFNGGTILGKLMRSIFDLYLFAPRGYSAFFTAFYLTIWLRIFYLMGRYIENMWMAVYIFFVEHKRIKKISLKNKIIFTITWPIFDIIGKYTMYVAIFKKVEWKQIPHESKVTIDDIRGDKHA